MCTPLICVHVNFDSLGDPVVNFSFAVPQVREDALKVFSHEDLAGMDYAAVAFGSEAERDAALGPTCGMVEFVAIQSEWVVGADTTTSTHAMSTVTPMPHADSDLPADGSPIATAGTT